MNCGIVDQLLAIFILFRFTNKKKCIKKSYIFYLLVLGKLICWLLRRILELFSVEIDKCTLCYLVSKLDFKNITAMRYLFSLIDVK